jgi:hypothetical protein
MLLSAGGGDVAAFFHSHVYDSGYTGAPVRYW